MTQKSNIYDLVQPVYIQTVREKNAIQDQEKKFTITLNILNVEQILAFRSPWHHVN
jgi:hypothetical protein